MHRFTALGALSAMLLSVPAQAEEVLVYLTYNSDGSVHYYDAKSVRVSGQFVRFWVTTDAKKDKTVKYRTSKSRHIVDCENEKWGTLQFVRYAASGAVIESGEIADNEVSWNTTIPGSLVQTWYETLCALR